MHRLTPAEMISLIRAQKPFEAVSDDYAFRLKVEAYIPLVCGAVHEGHQFRPSLWERCTHTAYERWYEEDPCTLSMVSGHPIVISGCDSRFEYDLNRPPDTAVYEDAWGKPLWKQRLPQKEKDRSLEKHHRFYEVVHALVETLEALHGAVLVVDMHSYNWKRWDRPVPTWNLGTHNIDNQRFGGVMEAWRSRLADIRLPHDIPPTALINDTFYGNGYFLKYITGHFDHTLVMATEIAKVYCDESSGVIYPEVVASVRRQLKELIPLQLLEFQQAL
ncbi:N-formylglutamate amidohydrolase [Robiginitalea sp. M366]|uniref:N-formylglutamate amidohydrolase n=1 Tax=Robiginitalea aestuariiviva TaxID=3036903 RepID=UPI00240D9E1A|nr:N-formylglutamate amidohydrolase [Robiginitalea aestuariiviva]MDG1572879.1 N-formylglutamate amidohydrolase [Robiginitalea aestuariiviva]